MTLRVGPFDHAHIEAAARIAADRIARMCALVPIVPAMKPTTITPLLERIIEAGPAVVALDGERIVGHLAAWVGSGHGRHWAFSPEWANATVGPEPRRALEAMYADVAAAWVAAGIRTHIVAVPVGDESTSEALGWLGFGIGTADAVRDLSPIAAAKTGIACRRASPDDVSTIAALERGLRDHLRRAPVFFTLAPERTVADHLARLLEPGVATFLAEDDGRAVAYLRIGPAAHDAATVIGDAGTASISGAFTIPDRRGTGIATELLAAAIDWANMAGYERCAVDFESMNVEARRFWMRWFRPVVLSMVRRVADPGPAA
jgi:GNAT superfamily N-acetyltransferase